MTEDLNQTNAKLTEKVRQKQQEIDDLVASLKQLNADAQTKLSEVTKMETEIKALNEEKDKRAEEVNTQINSSYTDIQKQKQQLLKQITQYQGKLDQQQAMVSETTTRAEQIQQLNSSLTKELQQLTVENAAYSNQLQNAPKAQPNADLPKYVTQFKALYEQSRQNYELRITPELLKNETAAHEAFLRASVHLGTINAADSLMHCLDGLIERYQVQLGEIEKVDGGC